MRKTGILMAMAMLAQTSSGLAGEEWTDRLVWLFGFDLAKEADLVEMDRILTGGAKHGLNGAVLSAGLDWLIDRPDEFNRGLDRVIEICRKNDLELIPSVFSFGYGGPFLGRNRNLAAALPVKDALFIAGAGGTARLEPDPPVEIRNGGFEEFEGNRFRGYGFHDAPGSISFADTRVFRSGKASIRFENLASDRWGHGRVNQRIEVHPDRAYLVSLWVKTEGLKPAGCFRMIALAPVEGERELLSRTFRVPETTGWMKVEAVLNPGEFSEVTVYCGAWDGKEGKFWVDDWKIEELGPQNVLRRPGTPVTVRSDDGKTVYREGRDYARLEDPQLHPWRINPAPDLKLVEGGRIKPGDHLRVSWYHPMIIYDSQVGTCMAEPELLEIAETGAKALGARLKPKRVLLNMDEIRVAGGCAACGGRDLAKLLGESVSRIARIVRKHSPGAEVCVWSDMFDPHHNARPNYYHVRGDYTGSWKHLSKDLVIAIWGGEANERSFDFFAKEGFPVMGACYYDAPDLAQVKDWIRLGRKHGNVRGFMYTTWEKKYDLLPEFLDLLR